MNFLKMVLVATAFVAGSAPAQAGNIVETAKGAETVNTLLVAAKAAGLADAPGASGNLTVSAPKDEAFAALPEGAVETLLKEQNRGQLVAVLSNLVLPRELVSNQLPERSIYVRKIKSDGDRVLVANKPSSGVTVDGANVVAADIKADNGIIHVNDKVMLPSK